MPSSNSEQGNNVIPGPGVRPVSREAKAYCGPAHGQQWPVRGTPPPAWVELPVGASSALYRLVRHRATGRPLRDSLGNYLYVPISNRDPQTLIEQEILALVSHDGGPSDLPGFSDRGPRRHRSGLRHEHGHREVATLRLRTPDGEGSGEAPG